MSHGLMVQRATSGLQDFLRTCFDGISFVLAVALALLGFVAFLLGPLLLSVYSPYLLLLYIPHAVLVAYGIGKAIQ